jgi:hypothetical protein
MYLEIPQGSKIDIQGLTCNIPPEGYVWNVLTKKLEFRGVYSRSDKQEDQYWERFPFPSWYKQIVKAEDEYEKKKKAGDPDFYDEKYEQYKQQEWDRRLNGFWVMIKGRAVYLVGPHYLYLQWFSIDIGYPKFRIPDLEYFYFLQYTIEDPESMGMIEITKRRFGKTFRAGLFLIEYVTRTKMTTAGIQSKTGGDAKKVFSKAVVAPFKKLPKFFRPEYDMSLGITPKTEMRFQQTNIRGKKAEEGLDKDELGSMIDHQSADVVAYDGQKLHRYVADESGKTTEVNIYDRHDVIRYCLLDDEGRIIGKALYTTTVEKLDTEKDGVQEAFKNLWNDSNQLDRKENGRTASGLYRFFMTSDRGRNFDIYGEPDVEKTVKEIIADRKSVAHNLRALSARIRKEARTIEEAFSTDGDKCIFNVVNLDSRGAQLRENPIVKRCVLFERQLDQTIKWRDVDPQTTNFYWKITAFPPTGQSNKSSSSSGVKRPGRTSEGGIAIDGYSNSQGGHKYGSKASAWIGLRFNILDPLNTGKAVGWLYGRPAVKEMLHEQVLMASEYYGFLAWYEHNSDDYLSYFRERGKIGYLGTYPLSTIDPIKRKDADRYRGFPTTPFSLTKQVDTGVGYVENYSHLIDFEELIEDLKKFDPNNRTEFDISVSWLMLLVILMEPVKVPEKAKEPLIKVYENPLYGKTSMN